MGNHTNVSEKQADAVGKSAGARGDPENAVPFRPDAAPADKDPSALEVYPLPGKIFRAGGERGHYTNL